MTLAFRSQVLPSRKSCIQRSYCDNRNITIFQRREALVDAISLLKEDHRKVERLFKEIEEAPNAKRGQLFKEVAKELTVHAELEEKLFYPTAREAKPTH